MRRRRQRQGVPALRRRCSRARSRPERSVRKCEKPAKQLVRTTSCGANTVPCGIVPVGTSNGNDDPSCKLSRPKSCRNVRRALPHELHGRDLVRRRRHVDRRHLLRSPRRGPVHAGRPGHLLDEGLGFVARARRARSTPSCGTRRPRGSGPVDPNYRGVVDAPLDAERRPVPGDPVLARLVRLSAAEPFLTPLLASRGYIVIAPPHPGNTINEFPNCGTPHAQAASFIDRPKDMTSCSTRCSRRTRIPSSPFFGAVDGSRVAMTGHSFGGLTTFLVAAQDPRVSVAVAMAPAAPSDRQVHPAVADHGRHHRQRREPPRRRAGLRGLLIAQDAGRDRARRTLCLLERLLPVARLQPAHDAHPGGGADSAVLRYVVPFLERYLGRRVDLVPLLGPPTGPGFVFESDL